VTNHRERTDADRARGLEAQLVSLRESYISLENEAIAVREGGKELDRVIVGLVTDLEAAHATMLRCADKLEMSGNEEPALVARELRDAATASVNYEEPA